MLPGKPGWRSGLTFLSNHKNDFLSQVWAIEIKWVSGVSVTAVVQGYWYTNVHDNAGTHAGLTPSQALLEDIEVDKTGKGDSSLYSDYYVPGSQAST